MRFLNSLVQLTRWWMDWSTTNRQQGTDLWCIQVFHHGSRKAAPAASAVLSSPAARSLLKCNIRLLGSLATKETTRSVPLRLTSWNSLFKLQLLFCVSSALGPLGYLKLCFLFALMWLQYMGYSRDTVQYRHNNNSKHMKMSLVSLFSIWFHGMLQNHLSGAQRSQRLQAASSHSSRSRLATFAFTSLN